MRGPDADRSGEMRARLSVRPKEDSLIALMFAAGAVAFVTGVLSDSVDQPFALVTVVALTGLAEALSVRLYFDGKVSVSFVGTVLAALLFGLPGAVLAGAAVALAGFWVARANARRLGFNFGHNVLAAWCGGALLSALEIGGGESLRAGAGWLIFGGVACATVLFTVDAWSVSAIISLTSGRGLRRCFGENFAWLFPHYVALGAVAGALGVVYGHLEIAGLLVLILPVLLSRYSISQFVERTRENVLRLERSNEQLQNAYIEIRDMSEELRSAYTGTLESLVTALDVRDQETRGHSVRVAQHSLDIAQMLGFSSEEELLTIYRGALMHDVGKIGVPDAILLKPAKLTEEEWEFMRKHPAMGYRILAQVPSLRPAARIVLAHHERWDGDGYPRRLKGEDIPVGARIFALCDTYDAIISDRPYRKGQSPDAALAEILRCAGSQFDPRVVEAFEAAFPRWRDEDPSGQRRPLYLPDWAQSRQAPDDLDELGLIAS